MEVDRKPETMRFVVEPSVEAFAGRGLAWIERDPVLNTVPATVARSRLAGLGRPGEKPTWITIESDNGDVIGAAVCTPPWPPVVPTISPMLAGHLAEFLYERGADVPGINGPVEQARAFAARWSELTGYVARVARELRLYRLRSLEPPLDVPGSWRLAVARDYDTCMKWFLRFADEVHDEHPIVERADVVARVDGGRMSVWEVGGAPVSLASWTLPASGVVRVGPVYTPPEQRRRGYGAAVTAAATSAILATGAEVCLFTDLANPISNSIYQRIGYQPVRDCVELVFS